MEKNLKNNTYIWITLLYTWNIVYQLYVNHIKWINKYFNSSKKNKCCWENSGTILRQEYWSGLQFPSPGTFLTQGSNVSPVSPAFFTDWATGEANFKKGEWFEVKEKQSKHKRECQCKPSWNKDTHIHLFFFPFKLWCWY